jgi:hypothetical protein
VAKTFEPVKGGVFELLHDGGTLTLELSAVLGTGLEGATTREQFSGTSARR